VKEEEEDSLEDEMEDLRPNTTRVRTEPIKVGEVSGPVQEQAESGGNETNTQSSSV